MKEKEGGKEREGEWEIDSVVLEGRKEGNRDTFYNSCLHFHLCLLQLLTRDDVHLDRNKWEGRKVVRKEGCLSRRKGS